MGLLSGRRLQTRLIWSMLGLALIGLVLGGVFGFRSAWPEIKARRHKAAAHKFWAQHWREVAGWVDNPDLRAWRHPNRPGAHDENYGGQYFDQRWPYVYALTLDSICREDEREFVRRHRDEIRAICRARVAYHERMSVRWSAASWLPWSDPGPDGPVPPVRTVVRDQSY